MNQYFLLNIDLKKLITNICQLRNIISLIFFEVRNIIFLLFKYIDYYPSKKKKLIISIIQTFQQHS